MRIAYIVTYFPALTETFIIRELLEFSRAGAEIREVRRRARRMIVVVTGRGACAGLVPPPRGLVAGGVVLGPAIRVCVVAGRKDGPGDAVEEKGGLRTPGSVAVGDITRAHQYEGIGTRGGDRIRPGLVPAERLTDGLLLAGRQLRNEEKQPSAVAKREERQQKPPTSH